MDNNYILDGLTSKVQTLVLRGIAGTGIRNDQWTNHVARMHQIFELAYQTWYTTIKLESSRPEFAFRNLPHHIQEQANEVKWQLELLHAWIVYSS